MKIFLEAVLVLLVLGALFTLFLWMIVCAISQAWHGNDHEALRDRARPWSRDA